MTAEQLLTENSPAAQLLQEHLNEKVSFGKGRKKKQWIIPLLQEVADFLLDEICGAKAKTLSIKINFAKIPGKNGETRFTVGETKKFELQLSDDIGLPMMIKTMAHECTHIAQVARGDLIHKSSRLAVWKGTEMAISAETERAHRNFDFDAYRDLPWEVEAHETAAKYVPIVKEKFKDFRLPEYPDLPLF